MPLTFTTLLWMNTFTDPYELVPIGVKEREHDVRPAHAEEGEP
eukprot:CAMPEP_0197519166 /NCGR_PEP_ID=MMETSP1318-20131121/4441_1 /TAXON_ID=552666 /ORGANISM="Partenskyella glossopodia, Strain RCC365" /LENGTH=42 /DNA_ID= /DNA_START= /DNA_END= /DNA_ORIENTATION=